MEGHTPRNRKMQTKVKPLGITKARTLALTIARARKTHPEWRLGQTIFNVLAEHYPPLAEKIRYANADPFYITDNVVRCYQIILTKTAFQNFEQTRLPGKSLVTRYKLAITAIAERKSQ